MQAMQCVQFPPHCGFPSSRRMLRSGQPSTHLPQEMQASVMIRDMGLLLFLISLVYIFVVFIKTLIRGVDVPGYASIVCLLLFLGGIIEFSIGIVGEYVSHIYLEAKDRPVYIIQETDLTEGRSRSDKKENADDKA